MASDICPIFLLICLSNPSCSIKEPLKLESEEEGFKILNDLYLNRKDAEVALAISGYFSSFDETKKAIDILEEFVKRDPNNIKVLNQLANLHLFDGNKDKAIEYKLIVYKYYDQKD